MEEFLKKQAEAESGMHLAFLIYMYCSFRHSSVAGSESSHSFHAQCGAIFYGTVTSSSVISFILPAAAGSLLAQPAEPVVEVVGSEAVTEQVSPIQHALMLLAHHSDPSDTTYICGHCPACDADCRKQSATAERLCGS